MKTSRSARFVLFLSLALAAAAGLSPVASANFGANFTVESSSDVVNAHPDFSLTADFSGAPKPADMNVEFPAGFRIAPAAVGSPCAISDAEVGECNANALIGSATVVVNSGAAVTGDVYMTEPPSGDYVAGFAIDVELPSSVGKFVSIGGLEFKLNGSSPAEEEQNAGQRQRLIFPSLPSESTNSTAVQLTQLSIDLDGTTGGSHPLLTNPSVCTPTTDLATASFTADDSSAAVSASEYAVVGCDADEIDPTLSVELSSPSANTYPAVDLETSLPIGSSAPQFLAYKLGTAIWTNSAAFGAVADMCPNAGIDEEGAFDPSGCPAQAQIATVKYTTPMFADPLEGKVWLVESSPFPSLAIEIGDFNAYARGIGGFSFPKVNPSCNSIFMQCKTETMIWFALPSLPMTKIEFEFVHEGRVNSTGQSMTPYVFRVAPAGSNTCVSPNDVRLNLASYANPIQMVRTQPVSLMGCTSGSPVNTEITSAPPSESNENQPTIEFDSIPTGQATSFECKIDDGAFATCASPFAVPSALAEGEHAIAVRSVNQYGHDTTPAVAEFVVDTEAPGPPNITTPYPGEVFPIGDISLHFEGEANASLECSIDAAPFEECESPLGLNFNEPGSHSIGVRQSDVAGNVSDPIVRNFSVAGEFGSTFVVETSTYEANEHPGMLLFADFSGAPRPSSMTVNLPSGMRIAPGALENPCPFEYVEVGECDESTTVGYAEIETTNGATAPGWVHFVEPSYPGAGATFVGKFTLPDSDDYIILRAETEHNLNGVSSITGAQPESQRQKLVFHEIPETTAQGNQFQLSKLTLLLGEQPENDFPLVTNPSVCPTIPDSMSIDANAADGSSASSLDEYPTIGCSSLTATRTISGMLTNPVAGQRTKAIFTVDTSPNDSPMRLVSLKIGPAIWPHNPALGDTSDQCPASSISSVNRTFDPSGCPAQAQIGLIRLTSPFFRQTVEGKIWLVSRAPYAALGFEIGEGQNQIKGAGLFSFPKVDPLCDDEDGPCPTEVVMTFGVPSIPASRLEFEFGAEGRTRPNGTTMPAELWRIPGADYSECQSPNSLRVSASSYSSTDAATSTDPLGILGCNSGSPLDTAFVDDPPVEVDERRPRFNFDSVPAGEADSFQCRIDGGLFSVCASPWTVPQDLPDGEHTVEVRSINEFGPDPLPVFAGFFVDADGSPPLEVAFNSYPESAIAGVPVDFLFEATEPDVDFECEVEGEWQACISPFTWTFSDAGVRSMNVRASNADGDVALATGESFEVYDGSDVIQFGREFPSRMGEWTEPVPVSSLAPDTTIECTVKETENEPPLLYNNCTMPFRVFANWPESNYEVSFRALNGNNEQVGETKTVTFAVDHTAPGIQFDNPVSPGEYVELDFHEIEFSSNATDVEGFECSLNGATFEPCVSPHVVSELELCRSDFVVRAVDEAGNAGQASTEFVHDPAPSSVNAVLDCLPDGPLPDPDDTSEWPGLTWLPSLGVSAFVDGFEAPAGTKFKCRINDRPWMRCFGASPIPEGVVGPGTHSFELLAEFDDREDPTPARITWESSFTAGEPETYLTELPNPLATLAPPAVSFDSIDPDASFECRVDELPWEVCSSPVDPAEDLDYNGEPGPHTLEVRAVAWGLFDESPEATSFTISPYLRAPAIISGPLDGDVVLSGTVAFGFSAVGIGAGFECAEDFGEFETCTSPFELSETTFETRAFTVRAVDALGNPGPSTTRVFEASGIDPLVSTAVDTALVSGPTADEVLPGGRVAFEFSATDPAASFECSIDAEPATSCYSPHEILDLQDGPHVFTVAARSGTGALDATPAIATFSVEVNEDFRPETYLEPLEEFEFGDHYSIARHSEPTLRFWSDTEGAKFECRIDSGDWKGCDSPFQIQTSTLPGPVEQGHYFEVRAISAGLVDSTASGYLAYKYSPEFDSRRHEIAADLVVPVTEEEPSGTRVLEHGMTVGGPTITIAARSIWSSGGTPTGYPVQCAIDDQPLRICGESFESDVLAAGWHQVKLRTPDAIGIRGITETFHFEVEPALAEGAGSEPNFIEFTLGPDDELIDGNQATFAFFTTRADTTIECKVADAEFRPCESPYTTPTLLEGAHEFVVRERRADGSISSVSTRSFDVPPMETEVKYRDLVEPGPNGDRVKPHVRRVINANLIDLAEGEAQAPVGYSASSVAPDYLKIRAVLDGLDLWPAAGEFLETLGFVGANSEAGVRIYMTGTTNSTRLIQEHFRTAEFSQNFYGGSYVTDLRQVGGVTHESYAFGWEWAQIPLVEGHVMSLEGTDISRTGENCDFQLQYTCWGVYQSAYRFVGGECERYPRGSHQFLVRGSGFGASEGWASLGSIAANAADSTTVIDCVDPADPDGDPIPMAFSNRFEYLPAAEAFNSLDAGLAANCPLNLCAGTVTIHLDDASAESLAGICEAELTRWLCLDIDPFDPPFGDPSWPEGDPVDAVSGNFTAPMVDLLAPGRGPALQFSRFYNAMDDRVSAVGRGWSWQGSMNLHETATGDVNVNLEDGRTVSFEPDSPDGYAVEEGSDERLTRFEDQAEGTVFEFSDAYGDRVIRFAEGGNVLYERDEQGNRVNYVYEGPRLTRMHNSEGHELTFEYGADGMLDSASDSLDRTVSFDRDDELLVSVTNPEGGTMQFGYEARHLINQVTEPNGEIVLRNEYDDDGRVSRQYVGESEAWDFSYGDQTTTVASPNGSSKIYRYDSSGKVAETTASAQGSEQFFYDHMGNVTRKVRPDGRSTTFEYDSVGRMVGETDTLGRQASYVYDEDGNLASTTDPLSRTTSYEYSDENDLVEIHDPLGGTTTYEYSAPGVKSAQISPRGARTEFAYDSAGRLVGERDPLGLWAHWTYDSAGNVSSTTDRRGFTSTFETDQLGGLRSATNPLQLETSFENDESGNLLETRSPLGNVRSNHLDGLGRTTHELVNGEIHKSYEYDQSGLMSASENAAGARTEYEHDQAGQLKSIINAEGEATTFQHDEFGQIIRETDGRGKTTRFAYDSEGNLISTVDPSGATWNYGYDLANRQVSRTDPRGIATTTEYDELDRPVRVNYPLGLTKELSYDADSNLIAESLAGETTTFSYDLNNRLTSVGLADGSVQSYGYDASGNLVSATDGQGRQVSFVYDSLNRITSTTDALGATTSLAYDADGRVASSSDLTGVSTRSYDNLGRLESVLSPSGYKHAYSYGRSDVPRAHQITRSSGGTPGDLIKRTEFARDLVGRLTRVQSRNSRGETIQQLKYAYDNSGNPVREIIDGDSKAYSYDDVGRLTKVLTAAGVVEQYGYDAVGNRVEKDDQPYQFDALNRLTSGLGESYEYDPQGRLSTRDSPSGIEEYEYDSLGRLTEVTPAGDAPIAYSYDALGRQVQRDSGDKVASFNYAFDDRPSSETTANAFGTASRPLDYRYGPSGLHEVDSRGGDAFFVESDGVGNVTAITDMRGQLALNNQFTSFGDRAQNGLESDIGQSPLRDCSICGMGGGLGRATDQDTGLVSMGARKYSPEHGRFSSRDPLLGTDQAPQTQNPYAYALNNPKTYVDPDGRTPALALFAVPEAGALLVGGATAVGATACLVFCDDLANAASEELAAMYASFVWAGSMATILSPHFKQAAISPGGKGRGPRRDGPETKPNGLPEIPGNPYRGKNAPHKWWVEQGKQRKITREQVRERLHLIKKKAGVGAADDVIIGKTGDVYDPRTHEIIGSLTQKVN